MAGHAFTCLALCSLTALAFAKPTALDSIAADEPTQGKSDPTQGAVDSHSGAPHSAMWYKSQTAAPSQIASSPNTAAAVGTTKTELMHTGSLYARLSMEQALDAITASAVAAVVEPSQRFIQSGSSQPSQEVGASLEASSLNSKGVGVRATSLPGAAKLSPTSAALQRICAAYLLELDGLRPEHREHAAATTDVKSKDTAAAGNDRCLFVLMKYGEKHAAAVATAERPVNPVFDDPADSGVTGSAGPTVDDFGNPTAMQKASSDFDLSNPTVNGPIDVTEPNPTDPSAVKTAVNLASLRALGSADLSAVEAAISRRLTYTAADAEKFDSDHKGGSIVATASGNNANVEQLTNQPESLAKLRRSYGRLVARAVPGVPDIEDIGAEASTLPPSVKGRRLYTHPPFPY